MNVIRYNTDTGLLAIYATAANAGTDMPVYASEKELANGKASISELVAFYNKHSDSQIKAFKDKATAARRVWAIVAGQVQEEGDEPSAPADAVNDEPSKRGRKPGTGKFAGKTVFAKSDVNPRRAGTKGFHSYEVIRGKAEGVPYADYIAGGGRPQDLAWDIDHKWAEVK